MPEGARPGRNERCPCGSGRKYKVCCGGANPPVPKSAAGLQVPGAPSPSVEHLARLAEGYLKAGRFADAIGPLTQATRLVPNSPALLNNLGMACLFARRIPDAIAWLSRAIAVAPSIASTHHHLGVAFSQAGDDDRALAAHRRAIALSPQLAEAHGRIGEILMQKGQTAAAAAAFELAYEAAHGRPFGRLCGAKARVAQRRAGEAETLLRALVGDGVSAGESRAPGPSVDIAWVAHMMLGNILQESGRFDEAAASFERSIVLAPGEAAAHYSLVSTRRLSEGERPLLERILGRLRAEGLPDEQRMTLHFAAGKALDDLGDYAAAIQEFDAANRIRRKREPRLDRREVEQRIDRLIARFTPDFFGGGAGMGMGRPDERPILVVGMPRSGTTLIERILSSHPRVAGGGELDFWNERGIAWSEAETEALAQASGALADEYLALLGAIGRDAARVTDKMPFNYLWLGLVHLIFPRARIVHCRRNPIDTCLSIYFTNFNRHLEYASDRGDLVFCYRQYLRLVEHWRAVLPAERWLDIDYEEATAEPEGAARRLVAFAGLDWDEACLRPERNPDAVKTASSWQARQPIYRRSVERWRHYAPWIGELGELGELLPG